MEKSPTIIIVTYNAWTYTQKLIHCLQKGVVGRYPIVFVDNGSTDDTLHKLRNLARLNGIKLLENGVNMGLPKAINRALKEAVHRDSDVILINNDIEIPESETEIWVSTLQKIALGLNDCGSLGARQINPTGQIIHAGAYLLPISRYGHSFAPGEPDLNQYIGTYEVETPQFALNYIPRKVLDVVGYLEEEIFAYAEDADYGERIKKAGFKNYYTSELTVIHHHQVTSKENKLDISSFHTKSMEVFNRKHPAEWKGKINLSSTLLPSLLGYTTACEEIIKALGREGHKVQYGSLYGAGCYEKRSDEFYVRDIQNSSPIEPNGIEISFGQGDCFHKNGGKYKIGWTMLETDGLPQEWVRQANFMDEVWTPTKFGKAVFEKAGITKPVYVMPLGVNIDRFHPNVKPIRDDLAISNDFIFFANLSWGTRKNPRMLIDAFAREFDKNKDKVSLVIKIYSQWPTKQYETDIADWLKGYHDHCPVQIMTDIKENLITYPKFIMPSIYASVDCFVNPSSGEGWGMTNLEALACGIPVITTNWGGGIEALKDMDGYSVSGEYSLMDGVYPIEVESLVQANEPGCAYYDNQNWAYPSAVSLMKQMREVYANYQTAKDAALRGSEQIRATKSWHKVAWKIIDRIEKIQYGKSSI